ncbi:protease inhibitor [Streptomyces glaucosporus]|uniref:Probable subtilase-type protease inhibitor n=1 Tax=Streptomyces glaucosporus TaxID=284044 RepID=A0ABN3IDK6_9ACTN
MRYAIKGLGVSAALTAACLAGTATAATAAPAEPEGLYAPSNLVLAVGEGEDPETVTVQRSVLLSCSPTSGGSHPEPGRACAELRSADGDVAALVETDGDRVCPMIWDPVTVTAEGVWEGRKVSYAHTFPNACAMENSTDALFSF